MIKGAIFDLDGTLIDSMFIWDTIGEDYLKSLDIQPRENLAETFKTFTLEQAAEHYRNHYGIIYSVPEIIEGINRMVKESYRTKVVLKPGVNDFLKRLRNAGVKMCIATVTDRRIAEDVLKQWKIWEYFSEIITCDEVGQNKESPEVYRKALKFLGTEKSETIVFEDAFHGVKTAKKDGFQVAAVFDSYELRQTEIKNYCDYYISNFENFYFETKMKTVLTIAGSDSSGGAGIQADIKTMTINGVYAMSAVTALTAQNTIGVRAILNSPPDFLKEQIDSIFEDIPPDSIKIGMVATSELIDVIADRLKFYHAKNIVLDPVMVATSGSALIKTDAINMLIKKLLPLATLVTPNIPEAEVLSNMKIKDKKDMIKAVEVIGKSYGCNILLKGGHGINDADDLLYENGRLIWFNGKRIQNPNTHGTGCTLSSAIASNLAKGFSLEEAVRKAKTYVTDSISAGLNLGKGSGPLKHNYMSNAEI